MQIGILGAADIAKRRFLPALKNCKELEFSKMAVSSDSRTEAGKEIIREYSGEIVVGYDKLINDESIEAVYIPLPPSLHYIWAKKALIKGKHVLVEKPSTISSKDTKELLKIASDNNLAFVENYGFVLHPQMREIKSIIQSGEIGCIRNIRTSFGFPERKKDDIRHSKELGGGALLDAGGYTIRLGIELLGRDTFITSSTMGYRADYDVDMYGTVSMINNVGQTVQASYGMDNSYKCELEVWGQKGSIYASRIYTAPSSMDTNITVTTSEGIRNIVVSKTDQFLKMIEHFILCTNSNKEREHEYDIVRKQIELIEEIKLKAGK